MNVLWWENTNQSKNNRKWPSKDGGNGHKSLYIIYFNSKTGFILIWPERSATRKMLQNPQFVTDRGVTFWTSSSLVKQMELLVCYEHNFFQLHLPKCSNWVQDSFDNNIFYSQFFVCSLYCFSHFKKHHVYVGQTARSPSCSCQCYTWHLLWKWAVSHRPHITY